MLSSYAPSLVSNAMDEMSFFVTGIVVLVREECRTTMLHDDMTLDRLKVYSQSIEESKHMRMARSFKRSGFSKKGQPRIMKRAQGQEEPNSVKVKLEKVGGSQNVKPTCVT